MTQILSVIIFFCKIGSGPPLPGSATLLYILTLYLLRQNGRASSNSKSPKKSPSKRPGKARNGNVKENTAKENGGESVAEENGETLGEENGGVRSAASSKSGESSNGNELNPVEEEEQ